MHEIGLLRASCHLSGYGGRDLFVLSSLLLGCGECLLNLSRFYQGFLALLPDGITQADARESSILSLMLWLAILKAGGAVWMNRA